MCVFAAECVIFELQYEIYYVQLFDKKKLLLTQSMQLQQQHQSLSITTFFKRNTVKMSRHADKTLEIFLSKYANNFGFACQRSMRNGEEHNLHSNTHTHTCTQVKVKAYSRRAAC